MGRECSYAPSSPADVGGAAPTLAIIAVRRRAFESGRRTTDMKPKLLPDRDRGCIAAPTSLSAVCGYGRGFGFPASALRTSVAFESPLGSPWSCLGSAVLGACGFSL